MRRGTLPLRLDELESRALPSSPGDVEWLQQFGSTLPAFSRNSATVAADSDGNVYVGGDVSGILPGQTSAGLLDAFVRKYDAAGNVLWTHQFGSAGSDQARGVAVDASGIYVVGSTSGTLPGQTSAGGDDVFVRKYDAAGNELWTRQFGGTPGPLNAADEGTGIAVNASGVYVAGWTSGTTLPGQPFAGDRVAAFVRKYDAAGNEIWTRQFTSSVSVQASSISADASGVYVAGITTGILPGGGTPDPFGDDAYVRNYDDAGNVVWTRQFGVSNSRVNGVAADASGVSVVGSTQFALPGQTKIGDQFNFDAFVRRYDTVGNELWTREFGTTSSDGAAAVAADAAGVYVAGNAGGILPGQTLPGGFVRKYDAAGNVVWTRQFGSSALPTSVAANGVGVHLAGNGSFPGQTGTGGADVFVRKYDTGGSEIWTRQFGGLLPAKDLARAVDADGNIYVAGQVFGRLPGQSSTDTPDNSDAFVRKYDAAGNEIWTRQFGSNSLDQATGITVDASGVYVVGTAGGALTGQTSAGGFDAFVRKYDSNGNLVWTRQFGTPFTIVPFFPDPNDSAAGVAADATGIYVAGSTNGAFPGLTNAGGFDAFLRKYDLNGNVVWTKQFGTAAADQASSVAANPAGEVYVTGNTAGTLPGQSSSGAQDVFVRKYFFSGAEVWTRQFGTAAADQATSVAADFAGVYVGGYTSGAFPGEANAGSDDAFVRKYDVGGAELWTREFGTPGSDQANGVAVGPSGIYVAGSTAGTLAGQTSAGGQDAFVRRYDFGGAAIWTGQFGTAAADSAMGVTVGTSGLYVAGVTTGVFPGQSSVGLEDIFVARLTDAVANTPPSNVTLNLSATVNENGTATLTGSFNDPDADDTHAVVINWGPGEGTTTVNLAAGVTTITATHAYVDDNPTGTASDVYPVSATVTDPAGGSASGGTNLTVNNVAPAVTVTGPDVGAVITVGTPVALTGAFTDAGPTDTHTAQWTIGGDTIGGSVTQGSGSGTVADSYTFSSAGVYSVRLTITDDDGSTGSDLVTVTVVGGPTTTAVSVSSPAPLFGVDDVTIAASVSVDSPGGGTPTGTVTFYDGTFALGTVNLADGSASLTLGAADLSAGSHTLRAVYSGDSAFAESDSTVAINVLVPSVVQGIVYLDFNNDGQVDFGERAVADVTVTLTGTDDRGHAVERTVQTDASGLYAFVNLRPSDAAGYAIAETQSASLTDGRDTAGTVNGTSTGGAANDTFSGVVLSQGGSIAENYNFGERPGTNGGVCPGQTATIGYWQNRNGQKLITALIGGASATQLGHWLAATFPNMYAALDCMTNAQVAAYYKKALFARASQCGSSGSTKIDAQVIATALAVYVTNQTLAGTTAIAYGFHVTADGVGARTFNVGCKGAAFGVANNSRLSVMDLLLAVNARSHNGLLYDLNGNGQISSSEASYRTMANDVFTGINEAGDI